MMNLRVPGKCAVVAAELTAGQVEADVGYDERYGREWGFVYSSGKSYD
jgi:hypothetical protein